MDSVIDTSRRCFVCGKVSDLHEHHIFPGYGRRKSSEKRGFKVYLCHTHHGEVHKHINSGMSLYMKRICQKYFEEHYGTREEFVKEFGRSIL